MLRRPQLPHPRARSVAAAEQRLRRTDQVLAPIASVPSSTLARRGVIVLLALVSVVLLGGSGLPPGNWPIPGPVVTEFDPPEQDWHRGHRGVDIVGAAGQTVRAAAAGTVTFAGRLVDRGVVVIDHGAARTTYEPLTPTVTVGEQVTVGQPIGTLVGGHAGCPSAACLHWGLRSGQDYLDPRLLINLHGGTSSGSVRLLPGEVREAASEAAAQRPAPAPGDPGVPGAPGRHGFTMPVQGPITSPFGMRVHPITGVYKLHDGTDWGAPCGAPIRAPHAGRVTTVTSHAAWGKRLVLDHGVVDGRAVRTSYNHASAFSVAVGSQVSAGQVIGAVGTTGYSTGCHLHLQLWLDGGIVDPMSWF